MRLVLIIIGTFLTFSSVSACAEVDGGQGVVDPNQVTKDYALRNLERAITIADAAFENYFEQSGMAMSRFYNPYTAKKSAEIGSVWMYTSSIEAVNSILGALEASKAKYPDLYSANHDRYVALLDRLYKNLDYYKGTFTLVSFTQTKEWSVYAVNRAETPGGADCKGVLNVYDDQMWLIRELIDSYELTGKTEYLTKAEYLTEYVLDGWDPHLDAKGNEIGGIPWGPGYSTKHSCSNGPMIYPLVKLHHIYKGKSDKVTYRYIDAYNKRQEKTVSKEEYYLDFARKVYEYQFSNLLREDGVYADMMGGWSIPETVSDELRGEQGIYYEIVDGVKYKASTHLSRAEGEAFTYNSGTMLSGGAGLYEATGEVRYFTELKNLADQSFAYFAKLDATREGYYTYQLGGFRVWFDCVLMRGYLDAYDSYSNTALAIDSFQQNLDYAYDNFLYGNLLPTSLLMGWNMDKNRNDIEAMFEFAFVTEYASLSRYISVN